MADTEQVVATRALVKHFGQVRAVDGIDLTVDRGEIYGFLGANGSGKTTTVRLLLGLVLATSGEIDLFGRPMPRSGGEVLHRVGSLVEGPAAYGHLSGATSLALFDASARMPAGPVGGGGPGRAARRARVSDAMDLVGLGSVGRRRVSAYSLGMRQRLGIAAALLRQPELLVLDEPTNGLDPQGIREVRQLLVELNHTGTTILLSSHLLAEVEQLCTRIGLLDRGRLVLQEDIATLRAPTGRTLVVTPDADRAVSLLTSDRVTRDGDHLLVETTDAAALNARLVAAGIRVEELGPERRTLEDVVAERTSERQAGEVAR
jgi:ABC-type multidrug transport system ATPase subunit